MASQRTKTLQEQTRKFLEQIREGSVAAHDVRDLRDVLRFHEHRYNIMNEPLVSDYEYDQLYKQLEALEQENPDLIVPDSPTQRVARGLTKDFPSVQHLVHMLSLDNSYNSTDLLDFDREPVF